MAPSVFQMSHDSVSSNSNPGIRSDQVYVHPLENGSTFSMSPRSLEMCTETLGSESGSNFHSSVDEFTRLVLPQQSKEVKTRGSFKKMDFPPPLTSIDGKDEGVKMRSVRGGGRLVIKAVFGNSLCRCCLKIEREKGRVRMCLVKEEEKEEVGVESESVDGSLWGCEWYVSRCNGDGSSGNDKISVLPFCLAIS